MPDDLAPEQIEQLARSLAMSSAMTDTDRLAVVELLREVALSRHGVALDPHKTPTASQLAADEPGKSC